MKKYNLINRLTGWIVFAIAAFTYLSTIEPTASFWDCPEFIAQGFKSEIGHPPGNPIFILAARFAATFAGGDVMSVAKCVNAMSAIFSALTILLLFWSITHLVKKLLINRGEEDKLTLAQYLVIMGSGICGALAYTWSDTFWFSAVEAEVYAFSSFCTALVFWLILKWEDHADEPHSDRWLIAIAYVLGVSLGVHLLNLLCIPAIALVFYYRKAEHSTLKGSIITLLISFAIIVLILYGLEPGFVELGQYFDLLFVNGMGMPFNSGVLFYAILLIAVLAWGIYELYKNTSTTRIKISFALSILLSGMLFIGDSLLIPVVLFLALCFYLFKLGNKVPVRVFTNVLLSTLVIFIGFCCYGLILIRSSQNTPLDENSPNNTFALAKYLSREQYGETPLFYGRTLFSDVLYEVDGRSQKPAMKQGRTQYAEQVKTDPSQPDHYISLGAKEDYRFNPELNMLFPRIHEGKRAEQYKAWIGGEWAQQVDATTAIDTEGNRIGSEYKTKPTMAENLRFFFGYQLNYMYFRYFMWNFAGRQNDIQGNGEVTHGNWISGFSFIDNPRLGDQSLLPDDLGKGNKGHNVFYLLPLLMGLLGLFWQAFRGKKGIEQFWVVFFFFFMTGIAIVLYLNQTPNQPRERDYAYAGSFYAYAIWIGMGVAALWRIGMSLLGKKKAQDEDEEKQTAVATNDNDNEGSSKAPALAFAAIAAIIGVLVPLQMVSQTWDDHDRSGRYCARDFGMNYLCGVPANGVIFCNGDNDTFPLWYLQEVEGYRTDVRAVNLSYLATDWYISQMRRAAYDSAPLSMYATDTTFAYDHRQISYFYEPLQSNDRVTAEQSLKDLYSQSAYHPELGNGIYTIKYPNTFIPVNVDEAVAAGIVPENQRDKAAPYIECDLSKMGGGMTSSQVMSFDIIANSVTDGWKRPCCFAMTVPDEYYLGLAPYMRCTGLTYEITPMYDPSNRRGEIACLTDTMYNNVMTKFRWGGLDVAEPGSLYLDETVSRMVTTVRTAMLSLAQSLIGEARAVKAGAMQPTGGMSAEAFINDRYTKANAVVDTMMAKLPVATCPFSIQQGDQTSTLLMMIADECSDSTMASKAKANAKEILVNEINRYAQYFPYLQTLKPSQTITSVDEYIRDRYMYLLMSDFYTYFPEDVAEGDKIAKELEERGVPDVKETAKSYAEAVKRQQQQQAQARAQAAAAAAKMQQQPQIAQQ